MTCGRKLGHFDCCSVVCGDCLSLMGEIPDSSVDAVIADPPYGCGKADWDDSFPDRWYERARRISRFVAIITGSCGLKDSVALVGNDFIDVIAARNMNGMTRGPLGFGSWIACVIAHGKPYTIGPNAFDFSINGDMPRHPSPKPIDYMLKLVERLCEPSDTILDPFLGSDTTAVAAKKLGRHFLGFEISEEYCRIASERIALVEAQPNLFEKVKITQAEFEDLAL